ncbi:MAG: CBS domain-containing protein [Caldilineaceae bacterium]|nr:CBS domain-containing protein [Caldilineaceae bacterium]HRJ43598.1 CBS domain-containing protein [Caldilineaceae bacterium]
MEFKHLTVLQAKRYGVFVCKGDDSLGYAAKEMAQRDVSALVVVDGEGLLEGIVTRTDLLRAGALEPEWSSLPVSSAMTVDVVTISMHENLGVVMELLLQEHIHRVVAVEREGAAQRPVALLSAADIVFHMARAASVS